jgi:hypothetical protein
VIKGYYEFLLESVLMTSQYLEDIIRTIDDTIAIDFLQLINKDIKTPYNAISLTDTNDKLSFVSDNQFQNKIKSGIDPLSLFSDTNNKTTVGRVIRQILKDNGKEYSDVDIAKFVDKFKAAWEKFKNKKENKEPFRLVSGEEIRFWYLSDTYCDDAKKGCGTLGKSCMIYEESQKYLDIYVENPNKCQLLILTSEEVGIECLKARALFWQTDRGPYLDRIYYTNSSEVEMMINWVKEKFNCNLNSKMSIGKLKVELESETNEYEYYPYMDTLAYYYTVNKTLYSYEPSFDVKKELLYCQDTGGGFDRLNQIYCEWLDESYPEDEVTWSKYHQSYLPKNYCCWSEYYNSELCENDSVYSETLQDNLPKDDSVEVYVDKKTQDWFPKNHDLIAHDDIDDEWYLISNMKEVNGEWYHKDNVKCVYEVKKSDIPRYKEIFSIEDHVKDDDCLVSSDLIGFYKFFMKDDSMQFILLDDYYRLVYTNVHYSEMLKSLKEKENSESVIEELESANYKLEDKENFYTHNNLVLDFGGLESIIKLFNESLDVKLNNSTIFDNAFDFTERVYRSHVQRDLLKSQIKKIFESSLMEFCKGVGGYELRNPHFFKNKLSEIIKMFEAVFPEYNDEDEIYYYLNMTAGTLEYSFRLLYDNPIRKEFPISSLRYFTKNPNKLPLK